MPIFESQSVVIILVNKIGDVTNIKNVLTANNQNSVPVEKIKLEGHAFYKCIIIDNFYSKTDPEALAKLIESANLLEPMSIQFMVKNSGEKCFSFFQGNAKGEFTRITRENIIVNMFT